MELDADGKEQKTAAETMSLASAAVVISAL